MYWQIVSLIVISCIAVILTSKELRKKKLIPKEVAIVSFIALTWPIYVTLLVIAYVSFVINYIRNS